MKSRKQEFERIVREKAKEYSRIYITSVDENEISFIWKARKVTHSLVIRFNLKPGELCWYAGWMPINAYGPDPISFANSVCDEWNRLGYNEK